MTLKKFAVAFSNSDGELSVKILTGTDWREATLSHPMSPWSELQELEPENDEDEPDNSVVIPHDEDGARAEAADHDLSFDVVEIA